MSRIIFGYSFKLFTQAFSHLSYKVPDQRDLLFSWQLGTVWPAGYTLENQNLGHGWDTGTPSKEIQNQDWQCRLGLEV